MVFSDLQNNDQVLFADGFECTINFSKTGELYFRRDNWNYCDQNGSFNHDTLEYKGNPNWNIIRVERKVDDVFYPIWTKIDGDIDANVEIIKINNRYYSKRFIEKVFSQLKEWNINIL